MQLSRLAVIVALDFGFLSRMSGCGSFGDGERARATPDSHPLRTADGCDRYRLARSWTLTPLKTLLVNSTTAMSC
jgi:hypothetical protein